MFGDAKSGARKSRQRKHRRLSRVYVLYHKHIWLSFSALDINHSWFLIKLYLFCYLLNRFINQAGVEHMARYWPLPFLCFYWPYRSISNIQPSWPHAWPITNIYSRNKAFESDQEDVCLGKFIVYFSETNISICTGKRGNL